MIIYERRAPRELEYDALIAVHAELMSKSMNGRLRNSAIPETAKKFETSESTVKRIWRRRQDGNCPEDAIQKVRNRKKVVSIASVLIRKKSTS